MLIWIYSDRFWVRSLILSGIVELLMTQNILAWNFDRGPFMGSVPQKGKIFKNGSPPSVLELECPNFHIILPWPYLKCYGTKRWSWVPFWVSRPHTNGQNFKIFVFQRRTLKITQYVDFRALIPYMLKIFGLGVPF